MKRFLFLFTVLLLGASLYAKRQRTGPARLVPIEEQAEVPDTIVPPDSTLVFSGYDKPNSALRETFFVTNQLPDSVTVLELNVTLTYFDMQGRMLHRVTHNVKSVIPPGQTRNVSVPAWDRNRAFHYYKSTPPSRRPSTPFRVSSSLNYVIVDN